jgi:hypothetical protein
MGKTPEYTRNAIRAYQEKKDIVNVAFPKGTKERIKAQGESINSFVNRLVLAELERLERQKIQERDIRHPDFYSSNDDLPDLPFS